MFRLICSLIVLLAMGLGISLAQTSGNSTSPAKSYKLPEVLLNLKLKDGRTFKNLVVKEVLKHEILIANVNGQQKLEADVLPDDLRKKYGLDTEEVAQYWQNKRKEQEEEKLAAKVEVKTTTVAPAPPVDAKKPEKDSPDKEKNRRFVFGRFNFVSDGKYHLIYQSFGSKYSSDRENDIADAQSYNYLNAPMVEAEKIAIRIGEKRYVNDERLFVYATETNEVTSNGYKIYILEKNIFEESRTFSTDLVTDQGIRNKKVLFQELVKKLRTQIARIRAKARGDYAWRADGYEKRINMLEADAVNLESGVDKNKKDRRRFVYGKMTPEAFRGSKDKDEIRISQSMGSSILSGRDIETADAQLYNYLEAECIDTRSVYIRGANNRYSNGDSIFAYVTETDEIDTDGNRIYTFEKDMFEVSVKGTANALPLDELSKLKSLFLERASKLRSRASKIREQAKGSITTIDRESLEKRAALLDKGAARFQAEASKL